jgi:hypothetical protein
VVEAMAVVGEEEAAVEAAAVVVEVEAGATDRHALRKSNGRKGQCLPPVFHFDFFCGFIVSASSDEISFPGLST